MCDIVTAKSTEFQLENNCIEIFSPNTEENSHVTEFKLMDKSEKPN